MSTLRIATSGYHVGHAIAPMVAVEKGLFQQEGFDDFLLLLEGLIPSFVERQALSTSMRERGIQIVLGAKIGSSLALNAQGEDLYIVAGWRFLPAADWYGKPGMRSIADLRGKRIGVRDLGGISQSMLQKEMRRAGIDPEKDVIWVRDRIFAYHNTKDHVEAVQQGGVDCVQSHPPFCRELEEMGCKVILSPRALYPKGRPERVVVARKAVIEERREELKAFLRSILRAFWLMRDQPDNFAYLADLEQRLRKKSPNEDERALRMFTTPGKLETMPLPIDGEVALSALERIAAEMKTEGELRPDFSVEGALKDGAVKEAFRELRSREDLAEQWERVSRIVAKYGY